MNHSIPIRLGMPLAAAFILVAAALVFSPGSVANAQQGVPDKPEGLTGRLLQFGSAELDWKDVQDAETYEAQYWDNTDASNNFWADPPSVEYDGSSAVLSGLPNQNVFYFQVRARNSAGLSEWSDNILVKNPEGRGWLPTIVNICERTPQVRDAILAMLPDINDCAAVTNSDLGSIGELVLQNQSIPTLQSEDFQGLANLTHLRLHNLGLDELPDGVFDGLSNLLRLRLSHLGISELPDGVFDGLSNLEWLSLGSRNLSELPDGVFDNLPNLESLYLADGSNLSELPEGLFDNLPNLESLSLNGNKALNQLPDGVFDHLTGLQWLSLANNNLGELPDGLFDNLSDLRWINLLGNNLSELPGGVFNGLSNLETLNLGRNSLSNLPGDVFEDLSSLEELLLRSNSLSELPDGVFGGLSNLEQLGLDHNSLRTLPDGVFDGLSSLKYVDLADNPGAPFTLTAELEQRGDDAFVVKVAEGAPFDMTITLSAQGGTLPGTTTTVGRGSVTSAELEVTPGGQGPVTISVESVAYKRRGRYSGIQTGLGEPLVLGDAENVNAPATGTPTVSGTAQVGETLTASTSGIADADGLTGVTYSYQWLSSGDTEIQGGTGAAYTLIPADAGKTIKVRVSFTDDGGFDESLTSAPTAVVAAATPQGICDRTEQVRDAILVKLPDVSDCAAVTDSDLSGVWGLGLVEAGIITLQGGDFQGLSNLNYLYLRENSLSELPDGVFDGLTNLQELHLSGNDLNALPDGVFDGLSNLLSILLLDRNDLSELPADVFDGFPNLNWLGLSGNNLSELPDGVFDSLSNLGQLHLSWNDLNALPDGVFDGLSNLNYLYLRENSLSELPDGVFDGLTNLQRLDLASNNLDSLPGGVFAGLSQLHTLILSANPGAPFTFTAELEQQGDDALVVKVAEGGVPFDTEVTLSAQGGTLSSTSVTIDRGGVTSEPFGVVPHGEGRVRVTISVESATFQDHRPSYTRGVRTGVGEPLVLKDADGNTRATGRPTISGTAQVGQTLTASTSGIVDVDGLSGVTYSYQWISNEGGVDTEIQGATDVTYVLVAADRGKTIKVRVTFRDDSDKEETVTSVATETVITDKGPGQPRNLEISRGADQLNVSWQAPSNDGGTAITSYKVQWKSGSQEYDGTAESTRQAVATDLSDLSYTITGLSGGSEGNEYTVRVIATNEAGDGFPSVEATGRPFLNTWTENLHRRIEGYVERYGADYPWLGETWSYLNENNIPVEVPRSTAERSRFMSYCGAYGTNGALGLMSCDAVKIVINYFSHGTATTIIHELAHAHTLANRVSDRPGPLGMAHLYFASLDLQGGVNGCEPRELYADVLTILTLDGASSSYWAPCNGDNPSRTQEAVAVVRSAVNGQMPQWFTDTYIDSEGNTDLEQVWTDVKALGDEKSRIGVVYQLRDEFGGYCENRKATESAFENGATRNPWRAGGCVPEAPGSLAVTVGSAELSLSWKAPDDDGGSPIEGYKVQWKSGAEELDGSATSARQAAVTDLTNLAYTITGLNNGDAHTVRVLAYNHNGDGAAAEVPATPRSTDATLSGLTLSGIDIGAFDSATTAYTASVANGVDETTVAPTTNDGEASYVIKLADADGVIPLAVGSNVITIEVTAEDGNASKTYTVTVTRATPTVSGPAVMVELSPSGSVEPGTAITATITFGGLESDSDTSTTDYTFRADVVNADACEGGGMGKDRYMYKVDEDPEVRTGSISASCAPGDYTVEVSISSPGNVELASATADFTVNDPAKQQPPPEPPASTDATLNGLTLSGVDFGTFDSATTGYTASVANDVTQTTVTPTTNDNGATYAIKLGGVADGDGVVPLAVGSNVITIEVTAADGDTVKTYTITVTRAEPPAPGLAVAIGLSPSGSVAEGTEITVTMSFANLESDTDTSDTDYIFRADVVNADACEGGGMGNDRYMYKADEDPEVRTGSISTSCAPGDYTVKVSISSPGNDELASATADFTVSTPAQQQPPPEPPASTDATLSNLALSNVDFGVFTSSTTGYFASVANDVTQTAVTPTVNDDGATYAIKLGGAVDDDGVIPLAVGSNVITIEVTAEDGNTAKTYTATVTRAAPPSTDATLSGLTLSGIDFGAFDSATTGYTASVANDVDETTVTPTTSDAGATYEIKLGGVTDDDGTITLAVGSNVITIEVTAENGNTVKTYKVTITRAEPDSEPEASTDATLSGLTLSGIDFGAFDSATTRYTASVANDVAETTVTPTTNDAGATHAVKLDGVADANSVIPLTVGSNVITIEVTAEDGETTKTYTVTVTRAEAPAPEPTVAIELSSDSVEEGTEITFTMSFANLTPDNDATLVFRADVVGADGCEGQGIGVARNISKVDEDPEIRTGTISGDCTAGDYTLQVSLSDDDMELASARADFAVVEPEPTDEPKPSSPPDVPDTPTGEVTGKGQVRLDWNDVEGATYYQVRFYDNADWVELPTDEISLVLDGSGATASNLPDYGFYYFAVRAGNAAGVSEWSDFLTLPNPEQ